MTISRSLDLLLPLMIAVLITNQDSLVAIQDAGVEKYQPLTIERIYNSDTLRERSFEPIWSSTVGGQYLRYWNSASIPGEFDIAQVDARKNAVEIIVPANLLVPARETKPLKIDHYEWSEDQHWLLIFTNTKKVWRTHSRGDYWILDRRTEILRKLGNNLPASSLMFAKISPNNQSVAYVCNGDIYLENLKSGEAKRLTETTSPEILNGTGDWVYEEEFDLKDGFRWSPDGKRILYWQFDTSAVPTFSLINNTDSLYPTVKQFKHTKVGQKNSAVRLGILNIDDQQTTWVSVEGDPSENYLPRAQWLDAERILIQRMNRAQDTNSVLVANALSGAVEVLFVDEDIAWVETCDDINFVNDGKQFTWISERDGWRHVYLVELATGRLDCITPGEYDVVDLQHVDNQQIYFLASPSNATQRHLYRVPLAGGPAQLVTPADRSRTNSYNIASDGSLAVRTWSTFDQPPTVELVSLPDHETLQTFTDNPEIRQEIEALAPTKTSFMKVGVEDGIQLDAWMFQPPGFDPDKKYPLIVYVYGEPWGSTVTDSWGGSEYLYHRMLAEQGYLVCSIDNRGTNVPRGRDFRKSVYGKVGMLPAEDQADAVRALLKHFPWLDAERVGVWGWSGGGSMSLNAIFKYPELYQTAIAVASVADQTYYDSIYQERYMGLLEQNDVGYRSGSPIHWAGNLQGNLLLIHGTGDDNCHYQTTERLIDELVKHDKPFSMMAYPNRSHSISEGENTTIHLRKLMLNYFLDNLPAGGR